MPAKVVMKTMLNTLNPVGVQLINFADRLLMTFCMADLTSIGVTCPLYKREQAM